MCITWRITKRYILTGGDFCITLRITIMKKDILAVRIGARERRLLDETQKLLKLSRSAIVREAIVRYAAQAESDAKLTPAQRWAPFVGSVDSGGMNLSVRTGEKVRAIFKERAKRRSR